MDLKYFIANIKKSFWSGNAKSITAIICTLILLPIIINKIGIENYGILSLSMVFGGLFGNFELGISKTVTVLFSQSNEKEKDKVFSTALVMIFSLLLFVGILFFIVNIFNNWMYYNGKRHSIIISKSINRLRTKSLIYLVFIQLLVYMLVIILSNAGI